MHNAAMRHTSRAGVPPSVLGRALTLLSSFRADDQALTLTELSRRSGLPKPTAHRLLKELETWGMVERTGDGVRLGLRLFELGQLAPRQRQLREVAAPALAQLQAQSGLTVHLAVLDGADVVYVEKLNPASGPVLPSRVGGRMPAHCTGVGKALLAYASTDALGWIGDAKFDRRTPRTVTMVGLLGRELKAVRERDLAFDREECTAGVGCVAVPVRDGEGSAVAALSVSGWSSQLRVPRLTVMLRQAADAVARALPLESFARGA